MSDDPGTITIRAMLKDLRWLAPANAAVLLALWALDARNLRQTFDRAGLFLAWVALTIGLGPLIWLRWMRHGAHGRRVWIALGLGMLWAVGVFGIVLVAVAALVPS